MPFVRSPLPSWRSANSTARVMTSGSGTKPCASVALAGSFSDSVVSCACAESGRAHITATAQQVSSFTVVALADCGPALIYGRAGWRGTPASRQGGCHTLQLFDRLLERAFLLEHLRPQIAGLLDARGRV